MRSGVLDVEEQTPVYLFGIAGLIEHLVLRHLEVPQPAPRTSPL